MTYILANIYAPNPNTAEKLTFFNNVLDTVLEFEERYNCSNTLIYGDFNARLHFRNSNEHSVLGQFCFGDPSAIVSANHNRSLLTEPCQALKLCIANTFIEQADEALVTFLAIGASPIADICSRAFAQFDLCIVDQHYQQCIIDSYSDRSEVLSSHHFIVFTHVRI